MAKEQLFSGLRKRWKRLSQGAENALKVMREGRMGAPYAAPYEQVTELGIARLRHYIGPDSEDVPTLSQPLLLIPPLMVTAEIYDISPELSAVTWLAANGIDVWLVDFGSPEKEEDWERTLDQHILAVDQAIQTIFEKTKQRVHIAGYSQGGMFAYQTAAYRKSEGIASIITFGSPVDLRRNMPVKLHEALAERFLSAARFALKGPLEDLKGIPGTLNSYGFKLVSPRQEVRHLLKMLGLMHDEEALKRVLPTRRFLGGEGFIAWPGPAFRKFFDEYIVKNRLLSGGFVIEGKTASLTDISIPILFFVGEKDDLAKPAAVRAIRKAVNHQNIYEVPVSAGHFGLVVGSRAMSDVWPKVVEWLAWHSDGASRPSFAGGEAHSAARALPPASAPPAPSSPTSATASTTAPTTATTEPSLGLSTGKEGNFTVQSLYDLATDLVDDIWQRLGDVSLDVTHLIHAMRWQLPRMAKALSMHDEARVNMGRALAEQAEAIPNEPFVFWRGQAHTYAEANRWVDRVASALVHHGCRPKHRVALAIQPHPGYLIAVTALNRIGAIPVLVPPEWEGATLHAMLEPCDISFVLTDTHHFARLHDLSLQKPHLILELPPRPFQLPKGTIDISNALDDSGLEALEDIELNPGRAGELAMILFTAGTSGIPKPVQITNRRWSLAALASAGTGTITPNDTVYCCVPLHQSAGMLIAIGGALVGGARLALAPQFSPTTFWNDIRRLGVTVAFYTGEMARLLIASPSSPASRHSLRLLIGNGMPKEVWDTIQQRIQGLQLLEFYGTAEGNVLLVNLQGEKSGSLGKPLLGKDDLAIVQYNLQTMSFFRDARGFCIPCAPGQPGILLSRIDRISSPLRFASYVDPSLQHNHVMRDVFALSDAWFVTGDWMVQDQDGDFWFLDALCHVFLHKGEPISPRQIGLTLQRAPGVAMAAACRIPPQSTSFSIQPNSSASKASVHAAKGEAETPSQDTSAQPSHSDATAQNIVTSSLSSEPILLAAIELQPGHTFENRALFEFVQRHLPPSQHPEYIRIVEKLHTTPNYRIDLSTIQAQGIDTSQFHDALYQYDPQQQTYKEI